MGTPEFAVPTLERLARVPEHTVAAVVCQPDRPAGRSGSLQLPAVKRAALALELPVHQPERLRGPEAVAWLRAQAPEVLVVVAFGQLLPAAVFELPRHGAINAHASLLPAYRGAAPIQWAIARGETATGVTTMRINAGLDSGDRLLQRPTAIGPEETAPGLSERLAAISAELIVETLAGLERGELRPQPQPVAGTLAPSLRRTDGQIDWNWTVTEIYNRWRGFQPWPGVHARFRGKQLAILNCRRIAASLDGEPGSLMERNGALEVCCRGGGLALERVRLESRQPLSGADFARGARITWGRERLD